MEIARQFITPAIIFLLTLAFGFWLSHTGKPYQGFLFNTHKLIALAGVVLAGMQFYKMLQTFDGLVFGLLVLQALCVLALFASGALMSAGKMDHTLMLTIHHFAPLVLVICWGLSMFLLKSSP